MCCAWAPIRPTTAINVLAQLKMTTELELWFGYQLSHPSDTALGRALQLATETNGIDTIKLLLSNFAPTSFNAHISFKTAATRGFVEAAELILTATHDAQTVLADNRFEIIHTVAHTGNIEMTTHLFNWLTETARTECLLGRRRLFMDAMDNGNAGIVRLLLSASGARGPCIETMRRYWLDNVIHRNHIELAKLIVEEVDYPSNHQYDMTTHLLGRAACLGHTALVAYAIDRPGERHKRIHAVQDQAIRLAAHHGHTEVVRLILDRTDSIEETIRVVNDSPIRFAARSGHTGTLRLLLSNVSSPMACLRAMDNFALHWAIRNHHRSTIALIIQKGNFTEWEVTQTKTSVINSINAMRHLVIPKQSTPKHKSKATKSRKRG